MPRIASWHSNLSTGPVLAGTGRRQTTDNPAANLHHHPELYAYISIDGNLDSGEAVICVGGTFPAGTLQLRFNTF